MFLFITVDAEAVHGSDPMNQMMWGKLQGFSGEYGVGLICDICEKYNYRATFFLDVYEHAYYGISALSSVAKYLSDRGHDVQLHTHPAWYKDSRDSLEIQDMKKRGSCFNSEKYWMNMNSLEEQIEIIRYGKELLQDWIKKPVIAHRAGAYAINDDTITALKENGIFIDSSMFFNHKHCKISYNINQPIEKDGMLEIPVTVFESNTSLEFLGIKFPWKTMYRKTDINDCSESELRSFAEQGNANNLGVLNLFLHSYSFVKFNYNFTRFSPNSYAIETFQKILEYASKKEEFHNIGFDQIDQKDNKQQLLKYQYDFIPKQNYIIDVKSKLKRYINNRIN